MEITRRRFLGSSTAAVVAAGAMAKGKVFGANDRVRVACIGVHGRGENHMHGFCGLPDAEVVALCDPDKKVLKDRANELKDLTKKRPKTHADMREIMADDRIDAVSIATPNHWHSLAAIWACQAGKDVYVEKPLSHNVWEGRQLAAAAKKYGRIVQHGAQRRSDPGWVRAMQRMRAGVIGEIYMARALCYKRRDSIGMGQAMPVPADLNWDLWQGPAQEREYWDYADKKGDRGIYVHYNWHWHWDYGNGDLGNQGVHQMDVGVWGLGKGFPVRVQSAGGRYTYEDHGETPNTLVSSYTYDDGTMLVFEVRGRATNKEADVGVGNLFYGSEGYMAEKKFFDTKGNEIPDEEGVGDDIVVDGNHYATFLRAVKSRKEEDVAGTAEEGHVASAHCHLGNIAYRVGSSLEFNPEKEVFVGNNDLAANALLSRKYREPFVVPEIA